MTAQKATAKIQRVDQPKGGRKKPVTILCILDGFGLSTKVENNCIALSKMKTFKKIVKSYPLITLNADGQSVGQQEGLVGNSEVGHINIGGLGLIPQLSYQITNSSLTSFNLNQELFPQQFHDPKALLQNGINNSQTSTVHLIGLFSTGSIHSDLRHWVGAIEAAGLGGALKIVLHIISDGRDSDRQSLLSTWEFFTKTYETRLKPFENKLHLGSLGGRFFAMDRDNNWDRVAKGLLPMLDCNIAQEDQNKNPDNGTYSTIKDYINKTFNLELDLNQKTETTHISFNQSNKNRRVDHIQLEIDALTPLDLVTSKNYKQQAFDETINPTSFIYFDDVEEEKKTLEFGIKQGDNVFLLNFRTDRFKQFTQLLCNLNQHFNLNLNIISLNDYGLNSIFKYTPVFESKPAKLNLAKAVSEMGLSQLHIAETEKYNHVTYFLNGGQNQQYENEDWNVIYSNKVNSHAQMPQMKAKEVTDYILEKGISDYDFIVVNYANPDMIGHTGNIEAGIESMEFLDTQLARLYEATLLNPNITLIITADHGNIEKVGEYLSDEHKKLTDTEHNANPVPLIIVSQNYESLISKLPSTILSLNDESKVNIRTSDLQILENLNESFRLIDLANENNNLNEINNYVIIQKLPKTTAPLYFSGVITLALLQVTNANHASKI